MVTIAVIAAVVAGLFFVVKKPLKLDASVKQGGHPVVCSSCGSFFAGSTAVGDIVRCAECGVYARVDSSRALAPIARDFIAPSHQFRAFLPEQPRWPASCALCGVPATRLEAMSVTYAGEATAEERLTASAVVGLASLGTLRVASMYVNVTERFKVPHCAMCSGGAKLEAAGVSFRSYGYFQQFIQANRATFGR